MDFLEGMSLTWFTSVILKSTLWLLILVCLSSILRNAPTARHFSLLGGLLGIGLLPFLNLFLPPLTLTFSPNLLSISGLGSVSKLGTSFIPQFFWLMLVSLWLLGALCLLGRLGLGIYRVRRLSQKSLSITSPKLQLQLAKLQNDLKLRRSVNLLVNSDINTAITWGWWKPKILLPEGALSCTKEYHIVLLHELAHIKRGDWLVHIFTSLVCALYWFNPLVWILAWQLRLEQEKACDLKVLSSGVKPSEYASLLLAMAQFRLRAIPALMVKTPPLEARLKEILAFKGIKATYKYWHTLSLIIVCGLGILLASLSPALPERSAATPAKDKEVATLMWQLMSAQKPKLTLASDYKEPNWQVIVSQKDGQTKVFIVLPNTLNLETWKDLVSSSSLNITIDSENTTSNTENPTQERRKSEESNGHWL